MTKLAKTYKVSSNNCDLIFFNNFKKFIKTPERIFFLKANKSCERGNHAHKKCTQFLMPINGDIEIYIDNGKKEKKYNLKFGTILKVEPLNWLKVKLKKRQILCVICNKPYSKNEYIRNYKEFKKKILKIND